MNKQDLLNEKLNLTKYRGLMEMKSWVQGRLRRNNEIKLPMDQLTVETVALALE